MEFKDYYSVLGVDPAADDKTIKTAYRKLARQYHPDVSEDADAEVKFKEVAEAYDVLHNPDKRAEYDEIRRARSQRQQDGGSFSSAGGFGGSAHADQDFTDFFNSVFGSQRGGFGYNQEPFSRKGQDVEVELPLFLEETLTDTVKPIEYFVPQMNDSGQRQNIKKSLKVKIPAGIGDGERIRVKGQGAPGIANAASGDLYLHIRRVPHPLFDVEGHNLIITVPIAPWEAALGAKVTVPTLTGKIQLTVQPNSQSGQRLRVRGKGLVGKHGLGDLHAVLNVVMPDAQATEDTKKLWSELAEAASFDPRAEWSNRQ